MAQQFAIIDLTEEWIYGVGSLEGYLNPADYPDERVIYITAAQFNTILEHPDYYVVDSFGVESIGTITMAGVAKGIIAAVGTITMSGIALSKPILSITISDGGSGYSVGDVLAVVQTGGANGTATVTSVDEGIVDGISLTTGGTGYSVDDGLETTVSPNVGVGCRVNVTAGGLETFTIDNQIFTWKASRGGTGEVAIGADAPAAVINIVTAITADLTTVVAEDSTGDTVKITAVTPGVIGNAIDFSEGSTNMSMDGSGHLGGTTPGVEAETFVIDSQTFKWVASRSVKGEVTIGADAPAAVINIVTAITADLASVSAVDGTGDTVVVTAKVTGVVGNSIVFSETSTNMEMNGSGHLGGTTAGVDAVLVARPLITTVATWDVTTIDADGVDAATLGAGLPNPTSISILIITAQGAEQIVPFDVTDGSFVLKSLIAGTYSVTARAAGYKDYTVSITAETP